MYKAKDGKAFGNNEMGRHYDATRGNSADKGDKAEPVEKESESPEMADSIEEHGPVEKMEMIAHHKDGHKHHSEHHDKESAHHHVDEAMGERDDEPAEGDDSMSSGGGEGAMPAIPGLRG